MNNIDERIKQCEKDLAAIQANLEKLKAEKEQKEQKWIVAVGGVSQSRVLLNLSALTDLTKDVLLTALRDNKTWISFLKNGGWGSISHAENGLSYYSGATKIVF